MRRSNRERQNGKSEKLPLLFAQKKKYYAYLLWISAIKNEKGKL